MIDNWETKESLQAYIEDSSNEGELDYMFSELYEIDLDSVCDCPYWIESYYMQEQDYKVQYIPGYYEPKKYGDILTIDGVQYEYIDSQLLSEEQEHQADDGSLCYEYRGPSFLRVLRPLEQEA